MYKNTSTGYNVGYNTSYDNFTGYNVGYNIS